MKYPIGIQDFRKLREGGYIYVDKAEHIHHILSRGDYFFLSRPRRFGKSLLGVYIQPEVHTAKGRCDALVQTDKYIYAFEFKLDKSAVEAWQQIEEKGYLAPWADSPKKKIAVGVSFSSKEKQVGDWGVKE